MKRQASEPPPILVALAPYLAALVLISSCSRTGQVGSGGPGKPGPAPVTVATATQSNVPVQVSGIGHVTAFSMVSVCSQVDGQLAKVLFQQGDDLKEGQLIFQIDPAPFDAAVNQADALLAKEIALADKAEVDARRSDELFAQKIESASDHELALATNAAIKATVMADRAALDNAKLQRSYCDIRSPINGRAGRLLVNAGNIIKKQDTSMLTINQIKPIYVDFPVPESKLADIRSHMAHEKLRVESAAPRQSHPSVGELLLINNTVDTNTGNIFLRAIFPNEDEALWPGQYVNSSVILARQDKVIVPAPAVQNSQNGEMVFVVKGNATVEERHVVPGTRFGEAISLDEGLRAGEQVVISGQLRLTNGAPITILNSGSEKVQSTASARP